MPAKWGTTQGCTTTGPLNFNQAGSFPQKECFWCPCFMCLSLSAWVGLLQQLSGSRIGSLFERRPHDVAAVTRISPRFLCVQSVLVRFTLSGSGKRLWHKVLLDVEGVPGGPHPWAFQAVEIPEEQILSLRQPEEEDHFYIDFESWTSWWTSET